MLSRAVWSMVLLPLVVGCATVQSEEAEPGSDGKADGATVSKKIEELTRDGELSKADVDELFDTSGDTVSKSEMLVIRDGVESTSYTVPAEAVEQALERARFANLLAPEAKELAANTGYGGNEVPAKVRELLARARLNGAVAFDVRETDSTGEGTWNPYPTTTPPTENMTLAHTLISPQGLADDRDNTTVTYNAIIGTETVSQPGGEDYEQVRYERRTGGTGNITAQYDEAYHPDIYARGTAGQIWASNCAFLSDGTIHCLPAARRSEAQDLILTNPHLSRCSDDPAFADDCHTLMYMGHITASRGVITSVEISGRISKEIGKGKINVIDPIALFAAWGFATTPNLTINFGNTSDGRPVRNVERAVIQAP